MTTKNVNKPEDETKPETLGIQTTALLSDDEFNDICLEFFGDDEHKCPSLHGSGGGYTTFGGCVSESSYTTW